MKRLIAFVVLILLLLAGILSVPFLMRPENHRAEITDALSKLFNKPVVLGQMTMKYWPPTVRLGQVAVLNDPGGTPLLQIETASASLDWTALFQRRWAPTGFNLIRWTLTATRKADGSWDVQDWLFRPRESSPSKGWAVQQVSWKEGEVRFVDPHAGVPQELVLEGVEGHWVLRQDAITTSGAFSSIGSPARFTFNAKGPFFGPSAWSGDLQLLDQSHTGAFHFEKQAASWEIKGGAAQWRLANAIAFLRFYGRGAPAALNASSPLLLENWEWRAKKESGRLSFEHTAGISGGASEAKGTVETHAGALWARMDAALKEVPVEAVLALTGESIPLEGKVTAITKNFEMRLSAQSLGTLKGEGFFDLTDGRYRAPGEPVKKLAKAKMMAYVRKKFPDLEENGVPVLHLSAHWQANEGMVVVNDGFLELPEIKAAWTGKLDPARQGLDGYVRIQIREKDPVLTRLIPVKYKSQPAHGRLQGTWQEWFLRAVPASRIPAAAQAKLRKALK